MMIFEYKDKMLEFQHKYDDNFISCETHMHTNIELFYFISGNCTFHIEGNIYVLKPGDILVMKSAESHFAEIKNTIPYERIVYNFDENIFEPIDYNKSLLNPILNRKSGQNNLFRLPNGNEIFNDLYSEYKESFLNTMVQPIIYSKLLSILLKINESYFNFGFDDNQKNSEVYHIIKYINNNLCEQLDLDTISKKFFISKSQLCLLFKKSTGSSLWKYITRKRLLALKKEIDCGEKPTIVYQKYGFKDYSTFYRSFVKQFGYNPKNSSNKTN